MLRVLAVGADPARLATLDQVLSAAIGEGTVYLGLNDHDLFRGLSTQVYDMVVIDCCCRPDALEPQLRRIRREWPRTPIVVIGSNGDAEAREKLREAGATDVLADGLKRACWRNLLRSLKKRPAAA